MSKWQCETCGQTISVADGFTPKVCCYCGNKELTDVTPRKPTLKYEENVRELARVTDKMNKLYAEYAPLHTRYEELMRYFRNVRQLGRMTDSEYEQLASLWKYRYNKNKNR